MNVLLPQLFQKIGYDFNACNNVTDILYNTDVINFIIKMIVDKNKTKQNGNTCNPFTPFVSVQLHIQGDPLSGQLGNATTYSAYPRRPTLTSAALFICLRCDQQAGL